MTETSNQDQVVEIAGKKYPRKEFKDLVAQIATEHNANSNPDPVIKHLFNDREEHYTESKKLSQEFKEFQKEYLKKINEYSNKIIRNRTLIDASEVAIVKEYLRPKEK